ncbi:MAG: ABC transporter ATP-binding protein [Planctomycetes bacterium]|nr:ABC transporter ATP-binding protein [Planctomycetota bacterium]
MMLQLDQVAKSYGPFQALAGITADVRQGVVGLLGPNGAGKSTLVKVLLGLVRLTGGGARVLGLDVRTQSRAIRELVGFMPEDDCTIAGLQGVQSVALAGQLAGLPARTALRRAHEMLDYVLLADERYRKIDTYSTGMRQKVKLAQALIHAPRLLFLDEPTNGLDPIGREKMLGIVRSLGQQGIGVVLSTHILADVEACCDSAMILGRGRLLVHDTLEALRRSVDPSCRVRVAGGTAGLAAALAARGCQVEPIAPEEVLVAGDGDLGGLVFAAARECGVAVREISKSRNSLEHTFLEAVRAGGGEER